MKIQFEINKIEEIKPVMAKLLHSGFSFSEKESRVFVEKKLTPYIKHFKENLWFIAEWPYVDKVFRDSYYNYFSTKHKFKEKNCIRISIFDKEINQDNFRIPSSVELLNGSLKGFIVIRPTPPHIIGRSIISPEALKNNSFRICSANFPATVNGVKLSLKGFPHSSQDTETITCAETSIWACMEYFGHQYPEYNPVLPSDIIDVLSKSAFERQLPSHGLDAIQISSTLKKFGFGNKIYFKDIFKDKFMSLLNTYIESGLPVIIGLNKLDQLSNTWKYDTPGHAVIFIGREELTDKHINGCFSIETVDKISIRDLSAMNHEYVIIDDNYPPYQLAEYNNPCKYSNDKRYDGLQIAYFIVPLHPKIYLEAFEAKRFLIELLTISKAKLPDNSLTAIRFYLTSSRSYKDWLIRESDMDMKMKKIIVNTSMAKFLWVAELGSSDSFKQKKATGLVLLDATSANTDNCKPLLLSVHNNQLVSFNLNTNKLMRAKLSLAPFNIYQGNLKSVIS